MRLLDAIINLLEEFRDVRDRVTNIDERLKAVELKMPEAGYRIVSEIEDE